MGGKTVHNGSGMFRLDELIHGIVRLEQRAVAAQSHTPHAFNTDRALKTTLLYLVGDIFQKNIALRAYTTRFRADVNVMVKMSILFAGFFRHGC